MSLCSVLAIVLLYTLLYVYLCFPRVVYSFIVRVGGCPVVVAQWSEHYQVKPGALGLTPSDSPPLFHFLLLHLKKP